MRFVAILSVPFFWIAASVAFGWIGFVTGVSIGLSVAAGILLFVATLRHDERQLADIIEKLTSKSVVPSEPGPARLIWLDGLVRDIDALSRRLARDGATLEALRQSDLSVVERLPDPLVVLDADHSVRRSNAAARRDYGTDLAAVLRHPGLQTALSTASESGQTQISDLSMHGPRDRDLRAAVVPLDAPLADGGTIIVVLSDRTRERAIEQMRADFVANVSHELRTPLASLIGFVETLRGPAVDDPEAQRRFLSIMAEQGARMHRIIDDLLSLSRIEVNEHVVPLEPLDAREVVESTVAGFEPRLAQTGVRIDLRIGADLPPLNGDRDQVAQVLQNLIDNAIKYGGGSEPIVVEIQTVAMGVAWPGKPGVVFSVRDRGVGIPRDQLPRLTERFYRVDKGRSRAVGGTGLGLAIVKHIVNRHRGQLDIQSEVGSGTTVRFWLPARSAETDQSSSLSIAAISASLKPK